MPDQEMSQPGIQHWVVVAYQKNGDETLSKPMAYSEAYQLWHKQNSRSPRRFAVRRAGA